MKKDMYDSFIEIVSGMRNFKSTGGKVYRLVDYNHDGIVVHDAKRDEDVEISKDDILNGLSFDDGDRLASNLRECMPAKQAGALAAIFFTIGYQEDLSYYRFIMGDDE
ncbi:MAG: hypothetical protein PUG12_00810 [Prevotella sp.]|nr:hypothetical protein [Prevotella sp.]